MPNCLNNFCWYVVNKEFDIDDATINFFKNAQGVAENNRDVDLGKIVGIPTYLAAPLFTS